MDAQDMLSGLDNVLESLVVSSVESMRKNADEKLKELVKFLRKDLYDIYLVSVESLLYFYLVYLVFKYGRDKIEKLLKSENIVNMFKQLYYDEFIGVARICESLVRYEVTELLKKEIV